jgi:hypothetical protein
VILEHKRAEHFDCRNSNKRPKDFHPTVGKSHLNHSIVCYKRYKAHFNGQPDFNSFALCKIACINKRLTAIQFNDEVLNARSCRYGRSMCSTLASFIPLPTAPVVPSSGLASGHRDSSNPITE